MGNDWTPIPARSGSAVDARPQGAWRPLEAHELPGLLADLYTAHGWNANDPCAELMRTRANSRIFKVETPEGNRILRVSPFPGRERMRALEHFRHWLREEGIPALLPLQPQRKPVRSRDMPWIEVFPEIQDPAPELQAGDKRLRSAADRQARFHAAADRYPRGEALGEALAHQTHLATFEDGSGWSAVGREDLSPFGQALRWALETLPTRSVADPSSADVPRLGHFDWNPGNLLWGEGRLAGPWIIDFDFCGTGSRVLDVALGMHRWSRFAEAGLEETGRRMSLYLRTYAEAWGALAGTRRVQAPTLRECLAALETQGRRNIAFILEKHYRHADSSSDGDLLRQFEMLHELHALA